MHNVVIISFGYMVARNSPMDPLTGIEPRTIRHYHMLYS